MMEDARDFVQSLTIRRSDLEDVRLFEDLVSSGVYRSSCIRFFGQPPDVPSLIEHCFLSVTALSPDGDFVAFAAFDTNPPGVKSIDGRHENSWEDWLNQVRGGIDSFSVHNCIWLQYLYVHWEDRKLHTDIVREMFKSAYSTLPTVQRVLFLARGEAEMGDDFTTGFTNIQQELFKELELFNRERLSIAKLHFDSHVYQSDRNSVIPVLEVRTARQEDYDDLETIFKAHSEFLPESKGEFYIARCIAEQNDQNKALVAQVNDKAVGLLYVTSDIDTKLLWQCFELDTYDNLLDSAYMDIVRTKREEIKEKRRIEDEQRRREEAETLRQETMVCHEVANRMALQEFMSLRSEELLKQIDDIMGNSEQYEQLDRDQVDHLLDQWLEGFQIRQPSDYFELHVGDGESAKKSLVCCIILTEKEFLLSCLQYFGLPEKYMEGEGHFYGWYKKKEEEEKAKRLQNLQAQQIRAKGKKEAAAAAKGKKDKKKVEERKVFELPTYFDLEPLKNALRSFFDANSDMRVRDT